MSTSTDEPSVEVIVDTCSVLDLVRHIDRPKLPAGDTGAASALLRRCEADGGTLGLTVVDLTRQEFDNNIDGVVDHMRNATQDLAKRLRQADRIVRDLGLDPLVTEVGWPSEFPARAEALARAVISHARVEPSTPEDLENAFMRSITPRAPARKGSPEVFDCIIAECAIRLAASRPPLSTFLLSSNTTDFGTATKQLHPELAEDFAGVGLQFTFTWTELRARLRAEPHAIVA